MKLPIGRGDDDDLFAHTRMSFGDHIEELRRRMLLAIAGFFVAMIIGLVVGKPMLDFIQAPVQLQLNKFYDARIAALQKAYDDEQAKRAADDPLDPAAAKELIVQIQEPGAEGLSWKPARIRFDPRQLSLLTDPASRAITRPSSLTVLTITESFMTYLLVSIYCGIVLSSPWISWQIWQFIAAGLYPHEKRYIHLYLPLSIVLFLGGCVLAEFVVLPIGISYLLSFSDWLGVETELRLSEWLSFAIVVPLVFGIAFQTPLVMLFAERVGFVKVEWYRKYRKIAIFVLAIVASLLAVSPDPFSMMALAIPMWGLYELGILLCRFAPRSRPLIEEPDPEEMVEV